MQKKMVFFRVSKATALALCCSQSRAGKAVSRIHFSRLLDGDPNDLSRTGNRDAEAEDGDGQAVSIRIKGHRLWKGQVRGDDRDMAARCELVHVLGAWGHREGAQHTEQAHQGLYGCPG